jgi:hypothetical protein
MQQPTGQVRAQVSGIRFLVAFQKNNRVAQTDSPGVNCPDHHCLPDCA